MSKVVKIGKINVNLDALKGASRSDVYQIFSHMREAWIDVLWSEYEKTIPSKEEEPIKKKKKKTKEGEE
jgi:hypothetical protein